MKQSSRLAAKWLLPSRQVRQPLRSFASPKQKLLALEGTLAAQDRPRAELQHQQHQQQQASSNHDDPASILGKLCQGPTACLLPALIGFFHEQVKLLQVQVASKVDKDNAEEEALPEGFHREQQKVPQIPLQPILGTGTPFAPSPELPETGTEPHASIHAPPPPADDKHQGISGSSDFMEAEAVAKRKQESHSLDDPDAEDVEEFGDIDPADQQNILDDIAQKEAAGGGSVSSSSTDAGPKKARATSVAAATLAMEAARKRAAETAKASKKPDSAGKCSGSAASDVQTTPPGVAETGSLAKTG